MKKNNKIIGLIIVVLIFFSANTSVAQNINGLNVKSIHYSEANGATGFFWVDSDANWIEQNSSGTRYYYKENRSRDDWSVYLKDESRNLIIQIDLYRKQISIVDGSTTQDLYPITNSYLLNNFTNGKKNAYSTRIVYFNGGSYLFQGESNGNAWSENDQYGNVKFVFNQLEIDEWSVYLYDEQRNVKIQLDLYRMKVIYSTENGPQSELYNITSYN